MCTSTVFLRCDCPRILDVPHLCLLVVNRRSCSWWPRMAYDNSALVWINLATSNSSLTWDKLFPCGLVFFIWFNSVQLYAVLFVPNNFIIPPVFCTEERPSSFSLHRNICFDVINNSFETFVYCLRGHFPFKKQFWKFSQNMCSCNFRGHDRTRVQWYHIFTDCDPAFTVDGFDNDTAQPLPLFLLQSQNPRTALHVWECNAPFFVRFDAFSFFLVCV